MEDGTGRTEKGGWGGGERAEPNAVRWVRLEGGRMGEAGVAVGERNNQKLSEFIGRYRRGVTQRC